VRLDRPYDDILSTLVTASCFVQHSERFPDAGGVTQENLEVPFLGGGFLSLAFAQGLLGSFAAQFMSHQYRPYPILRLPRGNQPP
jgi:hypothetical protein